MEQAVWIFIGMLSVVIGVLILTQVIVHTAEKNSGALIENAIVQLETQCNMVCGSERGTMLSTTVDLPAGSILSVSGQTICIEKDKERVCRLCDCVISTSDNILLNLTSAKGMFISHSYRCSFHKKPPLEIYCSG